MIHHDTHLDTKFTFSLGDLNILFSDLSYKQRLELIKSLIYTAPDMHVMKEKVRRSLDNLEVD